MSHQTVSVVYKSDRYEIYKVQDNFGETQPIYEVYDLETGAVTYFQTQEEAIKYVNSLSTSDVKIYTAPKTTTGGVVKESNPPTLKQGTEKTVAATGSNRPSIPPIAVGECGPETTIGKTNRELTATCDWTIKLNLDVCGEELKIIAANWQARITAKIEEWLPDSQFPILDDIRNAIETIKEWIEVIKQYIEELKQLIQCIASVVAAISELVVFIATLPADLLAQSFGCLNQFKNLLVEAAGIQTQGLEDTFNEANKLIDDTTSTAANLASEKNNILNPAPTPTPIKLQMP